MTKFRKGEILVAQIIFTDGTSTKKRPVVVLSGSQFNDKREEIIVAAITSNTIRRIFGDIRINQWKEAGLLFPSVVTGIILSIKKSLVEKKLGNLDKEDLEMVEKNLKKNLEL